MGKKGETKWKNDKRRVAVIALPPPHKHQPTSKACADDSIDEADFPVVVVVVG